MKKIILLVAVICSQMLAMAQQKKIDSLFRIINSQQADTHNTRAYILLSEAYRDFNVDSAEIFAQKGIDLAKTRKQVKMEAYAHNAMGYVKYYKGDYQASIAAFQNYYEAAKRNNDKIAMGFARNNEGNVYIELGDYLNAIDKYNQALELRKEADDSMGIAMSYNNMGYIYKDLGDYEKAISNFLFALRVYEKMNNKMAVGTTYNYIGSVYWRKKDYALAHQNIDKALQLHGENRDNGNIAICLHTKGAVYGDEKKYDSAVLYFQKARPLYEKNNDVRQLGLISADIGEIFERKGIHDSAIVYFKAGIQYNNSIGNKRSQASLYTGLANSLLHKNQLAACKQYLDSSFQIIEGTNKKEDFKNYYKVLSDYYKASGDAGNALKCLDMYSIYKDSLLNAENQKAIADMQTKYDVEKKDQQIKLQQSELLRRNILLIGLAALSLLLLLLGISYYNRMKLKQQTRLQEEIMKQQDFATKAVIEAEENERKRIGSDLHDGVGQLMSAAKMNLSAIEDRVSFQSEQDKQAYEKSIALVDEGCREVRAVSHTIMPNALLRAGLSNAVKEFIEKLDNRTLKINLHSAGLNERLDSNVETVLYRIIQECVNNVIKHSKANALDISLIKDADGISATIEDNGKGFHVVEKQKGDGIGLKNIQTRVTYLKGSLDIDSAPGRGTLIAIHVPLS
ncbi:MAG: sensor histidine kinase [Bacteroidetes bacterium]|nr:sensor histidine kinase [Bacteroidota bacterium]MBP6314002.1 sensor histidine kinase [Chitinophagaceae bacterium]